MSVRLHRSFAGADLVGFVALKRCRPTIFPAVVRGAAVRLIRGAKDAKAISLGWPRAVLSVFGFVIHGAKSRSRETLTFYTSGREAARVFSMRRQEKFIE